MNKAPSTVKPSKSIGLNFIINPAITAKILDFPCVCNYCGTRKD